MISVADLRAPRRWRARVALFSIVTIFAVADVAARTLRLFVIGNSFSSNATTFLPALAEAGGHELIIAKAQAGGCSLERHWKALEADFQEPGSAAARIYDTKKSLREMLNGGEWDVITIQQNSMNSGDPATYRPYAQKLHAFLREAQPNAEIVIHQTWAYRVDAPRFTRKSSDVHTANQREMWEHSRATYWQLARELGLRVIPVGDAFWRVDSDPVWGFRPDPQFNPAQLVRPALPPQPRSLHDGYKWNADGKLQQDANHASTAGRYLGALVWYALLFDESPERLTFAPPDVPADFAAHLRKVAAAVVRDVAAENRKARPAAHMSSPSR